MDERYPLQELDSMLELRQGMTILKGLTNVIHRYVSTLELSLVMVDGNVWKQLYVLAPRYGVCQAPLSVESGQLK